MKTFNKVNTKLLVLNGDLDPMVSSEQILALQNEMTESEADWQFINYGNTYHAFTNPLANDVAMEYSALIPLLSSGINAEY